MCSNISASICPSNSLIGPQIMMNAAPPTETKLSLMGPDISGPDGVSSITSPLNNNPLIQPFDQYRLHLYNYALHAERLRFVQNYGPLAGPICSALSPYGSRWGFPMTFLHNRFPPDEPKPQHSYIGLIAMAILSSPETKLVLSDIYQYILDNYPYFRTRGPGWRNSIRHNLSLNDCFIKAGRSANGKGHYWAIHPANIDDFRKGDFRRRKAQRKVRKHMGLAVDDDGNDSPSPPPLSPPPTANMWPMVSTPLIFPTFPAAISTSKKRQFDMASLLAPDEEPADTKRQCISRQSCASSSTEDLQDTNRLVSNISVEGLEESRLRGADENGVHQPLPPSESSPSPSSPNSGFNVDPANSWCYPVNVLHQSPLSTSPVDQQQLVARYYEQLSQARTLQLYQQWQMQRKVSFQSDVNNYSEDTEKNL